MSKQKESVVDFLNPTKLISSSIKKKRQLNKTYISSKGSIPQDFTSKLQPTDNSREQIKEGKSLHINNSKSLAGSRRKYEEEPKFLLDDPDVYREGENRKDQNQKFFTQNNNKKQGKSSSQKPSDFKNIQIYKSKPERQQLYKPQSNEDLDKKSKKSEAEASHKNSTQSQKLQFKEELKAQQIYYPIENKQIIQSNHVNEALKGKSSQNKIYLNEEITENKFENKDRKRSTASNYNTYQESLHEKPNDYHYSGKNSQVSKKSVDSPFQFQNMNPPEHQNYSSLQYQNAINNNQIKNNLEEKNSMYQQLNFSKKPALLVEHKNREYISNPVVHYQNLTSECFELIRKLVAMKGVLENQISELSHMLDNTSKFILNIDEQFSKIKERIMDYTSRCLEAAFTEYKKNMVDWSKYQEVERKGIELLNQLNVIVEAEERDIQQIVQKSQMSDYIAGVKKKEISNKIEEYVLIAKDIQSMREQCVRMRPTLNKERVKAFQHALIELASF